MTKAKRKQSTAAKGLKERFSYIQLSCKAKAVPIITGTAAPDKVFGLAANNHALGEFFTIFCSSTVNSFIIACKSNIFIVYLQIFLSEKWIITTLVWT